MTTESQHANALTDEQRARLKALLLGSRPATREPTIPKREDPSAPAPLSPAQRRLWILHNLDTNNTAYNLASLFRLRGSLDTSALGVALASLAQRHEMLRTVFLEDESGEPLQRVRTYPGKVLHIRDLRSALRVEGDGAEELIQKTVLEEANVRFDLRNGPAWRISLIRVAEADALLLINVHHICFDGWSLGIFVRELFNYYDQLRHNGKPNLKPLPVQYADYSIWNNRRIESDIGETQRRFWRQYLAGIPPLLDLPRDRTRPEHPSGAGAMRQLIIPPDKFKRLCALGQQQGATPFNVFMTVFALLLYRYTGQRDIVFGTPVSGREVEDTQGLIGVLANTLPICVRLEPEQSFREVLKQARNTALEAFDHADLSFDAIVEAVRPERIASANPVFQVMFAYQNKVDPVDLDGLHVIYEIYDPGTSKFDLSLDIFEGPEGPTCLFEYDTELFDHGRMLRMVSHFDRMIDAVLAGPDTAACDLDYLGEVERAALMAGARGTTGEAMPYRGTFIDVFREQVRIHGADTAVVDGARQLSYVELDRRSTLIAHALHHEGLSHGNVVGICMQRGSALIETILGVLKADAAFVALDPNHPPERLCYLAADAGARLVVGDGACVKALPTLSIPLLRHMDLVSDTICADRPVPVSQAGPEDTAYLIYTSGTTGDPKGARISHRNWLNALHGWIEVYRLGSEVGSHLQMANFPFDVFCGDFVRALGSGGKLVVCPQAALGDAAALYTLMRTQRIECAEFVPAVFRQLADYLRENDLTLDFIKVLIVASDSWYLREYREYRKLIGAGARLINSYGMAEATIDSTWFEDSAPEVADAEDANQLVPIGRPFPNVEVYVLDDHLQPVATGIPGEICIGGAGVSRGYLNRDELTQRKFVPHPFSPKAGERLYRSGDIGRLRVDGQLELLGRVDHQVKLRGQRIEPAEIETAMLRHPSVKQCLVLLQGGGSEVPRLVAYLVMADPNEVVDHKTLREHLRQWIPAHMIPSAYLALAAFPLSANGKIDRRALPKPCRQDDPKGTSFVAPRTLIEQLVSDAWCNALGHRRFGVQENFFELGGHSLIALQIVANLRKACNLDLPVQAIFQHPTVAELAGQIARLKGQGDHHDEALNAFTAVTPDLEHRYKPFPLTPVQEAYWLGRSGVFEFGNISAHSYDEFETGAIDTERFERAWNKVIQRHDMLRAVVRPDGNQQVLPEVPNYQVEVIDLRQADSDGVQVGLTAIRDEMSHQILDVQRWPTFDVRLSLLPEGKTRAHFSTDAIMFDVWSFLLVLDDLVNFYLDETFKPVPLEFSFRDYVLAEKTRQRSARYQRALAYWRERVPHLPPAPQLPLAKNPSQVQSPRFIRLHATLAPEHWGRLKQRAAAAGLTPTGVLLAAYAEVLAGHSRDPRFSLNLTFLSRHPVHPQVHDVVGEFTSLSLLAVDNTCASTFLERARTIQADLWQDLEHHDIGGVQVLREIARNTGNSTSARMPVVFTSALVLPMPEQKTDFPVTPVHRDGITQTSQVWLDCGVWEEQGALLCNWDVVPEMYQPGFIEAMFECFLQLTRRLADDAALWGADALALSDVPATYAPLPITPDYAESADAERTLVSLFLERVATDPQAIAVRSPECDLSYKELAERAFRLSDALHEQDLEAGSLVAVIMHKGWEQAVATLGIMAAGAAYLPIDPDLPEARIEHLLQQGRVRHVVTQPWLSERFVNTLDYRVQVIDHDRRPYTGTWITDHLPAADDLAYVIFTSGSTGTPKGVMIEHRGAVNTIDDINDRLGVGPGASVLAISALNFDLSVYDLFGLFAAGGCVVFPEYERRLDPAHWFDLLDRYAITLWNTVPALASLLTDYVSNTNLQLQSLRHMLMSGDWIPLNLPERILEIAPRTRLTSLGGATEASIWSILYPIERIQPEWQSIPYGRAMKNQGIYVLNHRLESCPTWVTGEIYIAGVGLARGYWRDKAKTDAAFIVHPRTGARLYRTGDLGRWCADGTVEFLGRIDHQVKVQGHRIELGEIEVTLLQHPGIKEAVVAVFGVQQGPKRLIGYVVPEESTAPDPAELQSFLQQSLPEYMVPQNWMLLERLPLSANGKVDRKALPQPEVDAAHAEHEPMQPRSRLEKRLAAIWRELLQVDRIGIHDNFFHAGGDSMLAIQMIMRLRSDLEIETNLASIFTSPTIARLAPQLEITRA